MCKISFEICHWGAVQEPMEELSHALHGTLFGKKESVFWEIKTG